MAIGKLIEEQHAEKIVKQEHARKAVNPKTRLLEIGQEPVGKKGVLVMGQVLTFPKKTRSQIERAVREGLTSKKLPEYIIEAVISNMEAASAEWVVEVPFSHHVTINPGPDLAGELQREMERIAKLSAENICAALWGKVFIERVALEVGLAEQGIDYRITKKS